MDTLNCSNKTWTESDFENSFSSCFSSHSTAPENESKVTFCDSDFELSLNEDDIAYSSTYAEPENSLDECLEYDDIDFNPSAASTPIRKSNRCGNRKISSPINILKQQCCQKQCLRSLSVNEVQQCQDEFNSLTECSQRNFIIDQVQRNFQICSKFNSFNLTVSGYSICRNAWCLIHNVTKGRFDSCLTLVRKGYKSISHGNKGKTHPMEKSTEATGWMDHFFHTIGDYMPHKSVINLPPTWDRRQVYNRMKQDFQVSAL